MNHEKIRSLSLKVSSILYSLTAEEREAVLALVHQHLIFAQMVSGLVEKVGDSLTEQPTIKGSEPHTIVRDEVETKGEENTDTESDGKQSSKFLTIKQVAQKLGISDGTVRNRMKATGIEGRNIPAGYGTKGRAQIVGLSHAEIARLAK